MLKKVLRGLEGWASLLIQMITAILVFASVRTTHGCFSPCENTGQQRGGLFLSFPILIEIVHLFSFWNLVANGLIIVIRLSCLTSTSPFLSSDLPRRGVVRQNGQGKPPFEALGDPGA